MQLKQSAVAGRQFLESVPGQLLIGSDEDVVAVLELCFSHRAKRVLLYSENLSDEFFDLSSRLAGAVLQKLRNYGVRIAIVRSPGLRLSSKFGELVAEERLGQHFRLFDNRETAQEWLCSL